jgi:hypothetical protein
MATPVSPVHVMPPPIPTPGQPRSFVLHQAHGPSSGLLPNTPSIGAGRTPVAAQALRHHRRPHGACKVTGRLRFGYDASVHDARAPVAAAWLLTGRTTLGPGRPPVGALAGSTSSRHSRLGTAASASHPNGGLLTTGVPQVSCRCVVRMQDAPSAPGTCGLWPLNGGPGTPGAARSRSVGTSMDETAASIRRGPVAIRRQCHLRLSAVTGDRHIIIDRTRHPRCAMGSAPGRDRRAECPPTPSRPLRLAIHRSPA